MKIYPSLLSFLIGVLTCFSVNAQNSGQITITGHTVTVTDGSESFSDATTTYAIGDVNIAFTVNVASALNVTGITAKLVGSTTEVTVPYTLSGNTYIGNTTIGATIPATGSKTAQVQVSVKHKSGDETKTETVTASQKVILYPKPSSTLQGTLPTTTVNVSDTQTVTLNATAATTGGNASGWEIEWLDNTSVIGTSAALTLNAPFTIAGDQKKTVNHKIVAHVVNKAPTGDVWYNTSTEAATYKVHNAPQTPTAFYKYNYKDVAGASKTFYTLYIDTNADSYTFGTVPSNDPFLETNTNVTNVASIYDYDGFKVSSAKTNLTSTYTPACVFTVQSLIASSSKFGNLNYSGPVMKDNTIYAHTGDKGRMFGTATFGAAEVSYDGLYDGATKLTNQTFTFATGETEYIAVHSAAIPYGTQNQSKVIEFLSDYTLKVVAYAVPTWTNTIATTGSLKVSDIEQTNITFTATKPSGGSSQEWTVQWTEDGANISDATTWSYNLKKKYDITGLAKQTASHAINAKVSQKSPEGTVWLTGTAQATDLTIYNAPPAIGSLRGYTLDSENTLYIAEYLGMTDAQIASNDVEIYFNGTKNPDRYSLNVVPLTAYTQYTYDDGQVVKTPTQNYPTGLLNTFDETLNITLSKSSNAAEYYNGPVQATGKWYGLPGDVATISQHLSCSWGTLVNTKYECNDQSAVEGTTMNLSTVGEYNYRSVYSVNIHIDDVNNTVINKNVTLRGEKALKAEILPAPVYPELTSAVLDMQVRDIDAVNTTVSVSEPSGAVTTGWSLQWTAGHDNIVGATSATMPISGKFEVSGNEQKKGTNAYALTFTNKSPTGTNWISGTINAGTITSYNTPAAPAALNSITTPEGTVYVAAQTGLSDTQLSNYKYKFVFDGVAQTSRYTSTPVTAVTTLFEYADGFMCYSDPVAYNSANNVTYKWGTPLEGITSTTSDGYYLGHVAASANEYYGLAGLEEIAFSDEIEPTNSPSFLSLLEVIDDKVIVNKDGSETTYSGMALNHVPNAAGTYFYSRESKIRYTADPVSYVTVTSKITSDKRYNILAAPHYPAASSNSNPVKFDDIDEISLSTVISAASGANASAWSYAWQIESQNGEVTNFAQSSNTAFTPITLPIDSDKPVSVKYTPTITFTNDAPTGDTWIKGDITANAFTVYNTPVQPQGMSHYWDIGIPESFYVLTNLGMTDATLSANSYKFRFDSQLSDTRRINLSSKPSKVAAVWVYDDYESPREANYPTLTTTECTLDYGVALTTEKGNLSGDPRYLVVKVENPVDKSLNAFLGTQFNIDIHCEATGFTPIYSSDSHLSLLHNDAIDTNIPVVNGAVNYTTIPTVGGDYTWELVVNGEFDVETEVNQTTPFHCLYNMKSGNSVIRLWNNPIDPVVSSTNNSIWTPDYKAPEINFAVTQAQNGTASGWSYIWDGPSTNYPNSPSITSEQVLDDPSMAKNIIGYDYSVVAENVSPDPSIVWYRTLPLQVGHVDVYNAPNSVGRLVYYTDGEDANNSSYIACNVGLSDDQLSTYDYRFKFDDDMIASRYMYSGADTYSTVNSVWLYSDGKNIQGQTPATLSASVTPEFAYNMQVTKGTNESDTRYHGAVYDATNNCYHAILGSEVKVGFTQGSALFEFKNATLEVNNGDEVLTPGANGFSYSPAVGTYNFRLNGNVAFIVDTYRNASGNEVRQLMDFNTEFSDISKVQIHVMPVYPEYTGTTMYQYRNIDTKTDKLTVSAGQNDTNWSYKWSSVTKPQSGSQTSNNNLGNTTSINIKADNINNANSTYVTTDYKISYENAAPVAGAEPWITGSIDVAKARTYNTPNKPGEVVKYIGGNDVASPTKYMARNTGYSDSDIAQKAVKFDVNGQTFTTRVFDGITSSNVQCRSYWDYVAADGFDAFRSQSEITSYAKKDIKPVMNMTLTLGTSQYDNDGHYLGHKSGPDGHQYALVTTKGQYDYSIASGTGCSLASSTINFTNGTGNLSTVSGATPTVNTTYVVEGSYEGFVDAELSMVVEDNISGTNGTTNMPASFEIPEPAQVEIYAAPVYPVIEGYKTQFRDIDPLRPEFSSVYANGAVYDGWKYEWQEGGKTITTTLDDDINLGISAINSGEKATEQRTFTFKWRNVLPTGDTFISGQSEYPVTIYNTPEQPATLQRKGNGTSHIYIVTGMSVNDDQLKAIDLRLQFGNGNDALSTEEAGKRWYQYSSAPSDPWVRSLWIYSDFDCYSNVTDTSGSRDDVSSIQNIMIDMDNDETVEVFTTAGVRIGRHQVKHLAPGVYLIRRGSGIDAVVEKVVVR